MKRLGNTGMFKMIGLLSSLAAVLCIMMQYYLTFLTYGMWITFYEANMH